ncbi:uncharacterized protein LOC114240674 [Bombyx mandarina]|uniref:Uncharacterized protein LOC114240674 n=1 Tax=Bombyx mandarina TaxID=7092 RepID=A0A6J2JCF6_BOMMA|nr:uncharacterized protein LOC114240674 [Bombyx mandarina]
MSAKSTTPRKRNQRITARLSQENINKCNKSVERQRARTFVTWYKQMIDNERQNLALYLADDAFLEWFGRTIKTRKKVSAFLKHDMHCSKHDFTSVESIEKIQNRHEKLHRRDDGTLVSPLHSPEIKTGKPGKKKLSFNCSPEWAEGCQPLDEIKIDKKKVKIENNVYEIVEQEQNSLKRQYPEDENNIDISQNGDGMGQKPKRKCIPVTPPNPELGQGDCLPSTSGTDSDKSHDTLNAQLQKLAVECNGYIEFTRTRNSRSNEGMKWDRKCKVQISYSEDPLNIGEYIIWALRYTDESKCRRNLLPDFEEVAREEIRT